MNRLDEIKKRCEHWNKAQRGSIYDRLMGKALIQEDVPWLLGELELLEGRLKSNNEHHDLLARTMGDAIKTRERVKDKLRKQIAHTTKARRQRDEARAEVDKLRAELEAAKRFMREMADEPNWCRECANCPCCKSVEDWAGCDGFAWHGPCAENGGTPHE